MIISVEFVWELGRQWRLGFDNLRGNKRGRIIVTYFEWRFIYFLIKKIKTNSENILGRVLEGFQKFLISFSFLKF